MQEQIELRERWSTQFRDCIRDEKSPAYRELEQLPPRVASAGMGG